MIDNVQIFAENNAKRKYKSPINAFPSLVSMK